MIHTRQQGRRTPEYVAWIDVETTGTDPESDYLLEVGAVVTDLHGKIIGNTFEALVSVPNLSSVIAQTSDDVCLMHEKSKLWLDLWTKEVKSLGCVDKEISDWLSLNIAEENATVYFGGNSITLDRNFVRSNLPGFYKKLSYRSIDVTSLSIAIQSNTYDLGYEKSKEHRALSDAVDSAREYLHYINFLKTHN